MLTATPHTPAPIERPDDPVIGSALGAMDTDAVLAAVRDRFAGTVGSTAVACRFVEALYHPRRYVRAAFSLLDDPDVPVNRYWPQGQIIYLHHPVRQPMSRRGRVVQLGGVGFECYAFPNDRRLRGLRRFTGRQEATACWRRWLDGRGDAFDPDPRSLRRVLIRYVPEQKWMARFRCRGVDHTTGQAGKRSVAVRAADTDAVMDLAHRHAMLARYARRGALLCDVPDVVGVDAAVGSIAIDWVKHVPLTDAIRSAGADVVFDRVVEALGSLHDARVAGVVGLTPSAMLDRVKQAADDLVTTGALSVDRLEHLRGYCNQVASKMKWSAAGALLHNDLHTRQIGLRDGRVVFFDLERLATGDPVVDVANLFVQLRMVGLRDDFDVSVDESRRFAGAFVAAWRRRHGDFDRSAFGVCAVVSALELARGMMRHLRCGWVSTVRSCVDLATELAADGWT